ncbi:MAG: 4Fe-4S binding protein [Anaerolineaceae bacterium]|nr:4Fe-4S binding protein [Anaerolineaceae bacterium]
MAELNLPVVDAKKCILCGICVDACPEKVLAIEAGALVYANPEACTLCAVCETVCPESAVACYYQISWAE